MCDLRHRLLKAVDFAEEAGADKADILAELAAFTRVYAEIHGLADAFDAGPASRFDDCGRRLPPRLATVAGGR